MSIVLEAPTSPATTYNATVYTEAEGSYWAEVLDLPGCFTQGQTLDEVYHNLTEAIACHLDVEPASVRVGSLEMRD